MSLSTLIVQREIASIREVEEALARQVLYGGDFVTNLLEVCRIDEAQLLPIVAESLGLPPASPGELPRPEPEAQRLVAAEVAVERNLAPLTVDRYGLTVAVAEPLSPDVEQELAFALALPISQKIAPLVRIRQALTRDYGVALDRRLQRLLQRMMSEGPRAGSSYPPMRNADLRLGAPRPPSIMPPAPQSKPPAPLRPSVPPGGGTRTLLRQTEMPALRPLRRRRGAITVELARTELEDATERDTIFDLLFEFTRQYFDYTAVFIVHGELAEGRDAFGEGAARDKVARIGVPLDLPSILSAAREKKATVQRVPAADGLDQVLMSDLGRSGLTTCIVLPIVVRARVVAMLLGDGGDTGIDRSTLEDVEGIVLAGTAAFERLIVRRKLAGSSVPPAMGGDPAAPRILMPSLAPPTKLSEPYRPAVEELAPAIRDLMIEHESHPGVTARDPVVQTVLPGETSVIGGRGKTDKPPPPPNVLAVRKPSGRPIPREEPGTDAGLAGRWPAVTAPSNLGNAARSAMQTAGMAAAAQAAGASPSPPHSVASPSSAGPRSRRRGEAPSLDFGALPPPSSMFGSETFGSGDDSERRLLAEIQGRPLEIEPAPTTSRDQHPPVLSPSNAPPPEPDSAFEPPPSPKAESPPPMKVAAQIITDRSPISVDPNVAPDADAVPDAARSAPTMPPASSELVSDDDSDVQLTDPYELELTPFSAPFALTREDPRAPPIAPAVTNAFVPDDEPTLIDDNTDSRRFPSKPPTPWPSSMTPELDRQEPPPRLPPIPEPTVSQRSMPLSEQQISVAPHRPPSARSDDTRILPSVIVDVASEYVGLVDRVIGKIPADPGGGTADDAEAELLRAGGYAMPAIMVRFPGPITIEAERLVDGPLPRVAECGPVLRLVASQRRTALPFVLSHVEDPDLEKRFWATYLLTELYYPEVLEPILQRVFDEEPRVRLAARAAARAFADAHPTTIVERLEQIAMDTAGTRHNRTLAIEALGETREALAVPALIPLLDDADLAVVTASRVALLLITRLDLGTASQKWQTWWTPNKDRHRLEWLIDALMNESAALRAAAGEELKTITKEYFGYYDDLPKRERERAQSRYREWWNNVGRVRFSRSAASR